MPLAMLLYEFASLHLLPYSLCLLLYLELRMVVEQFRRWDVFSEL